MFKPTKKQHLVNKNYADKNGGSGGGGTEPLIVNDNNGTLDKTWQEIHDAFVSGQIVLILHGEDNVESVSDVSANELPPESGTIVYGVNAYTTDSANGYPSPSIGDLG